MERYEGYTLIILLMAVTVLSIGLLTAIPVWQTQIQRENEEELIFRGKQYVEAIRLFQMKNPGSFPKSLEELAEKRFLRRLYKDPMTREGKWNVILPFEGEPRGTAAKRENPVQRILVVPEESLRSFENKRLLGVVSSSTKKSIKIYCGNDSYDKWLFFYGQDPNKMPEVIYSGRAEGKK